MAIYVGPDGQEVEAVYVPKSKNWKVINRTKTTVHINKDFFERRYKQKFPRMADYSSANPKAKAVAQ